MDDCGLKITIGCKRIITTTSISTFYNFVIYRHALVMDSDFGIPIKLIALELLWELLLWFVPAPSTDAQGARWYFC